MYGPPGQRSSWSSSVRHKKLLVCVQSAGLELSLGRVRSPSLKIFLVRIPFNFSVRGSLFITMQNVSVNQNWYCSAKKCQNPLCTDKQNFYRHFSWFTISLQLKRESEENDSFWIDWPIKIKIFSESSIKMEVGNWRIFFRAFSS